MKKIYKIIVICSLGLFILAGAGFYAWARIENTAAKKVMPDNSLATVSAKKMSVVPVQALPIAEDAPKKQELETEADGNSASSTPPVVVEDTGPHKLIDIDLSEQKLRYYNPDGLEVGSFLISSGVRWMPTPKGTFKVQVKRPVVLYVGPDYYFPNTKWNLQFLPRYYIHGAY